MIPAAATPKPVPVVESTWTLVTQITALVTTLQSHLQPRIAAKQTLTDPDSQRLAALIVLTSQLGQTVEQLQEMS